MKRELFDYVIKYCGSCEEPHTEVSIYYRDKIIVDQAISFGIIPNNLVEEKISEFMSEPTEKMFEIDKEWQIYNREKKLKKVVWKSQKN